MLILWQRIKWKQVLDTKSRRFQFLYEIGINNYVTQDDI